MKPTRRRHSISSFCKTIHIRRYIVGWGDRSTPLINLLRSSEVFILTFFKRNIIFSHLQEVVRHVYVGFWVNTERILSIRNWNISCNRPRKYVPNSIKCQGPRGATRKEEFSDATVVRFLKIISYFRCAHPS